MNCSPSSIRNREPIFDVLKEYIATDTRVLEIGSFDASHAIYMTPLLEKVNWVTTDRLLNHEQIKQNLKEAKIKNIHGPEKLEVGVDDFPKGGFDYVFTANTFHIMSWKEVKACIKLMGKRLREGSLVFIYGPFNYAGEFTSESNRQFDHSLKTKDAHMGIRNFEDVLRAMEKVGFKLLQDHSMPANNHLLVFERLPFGDSK